MPDVFDTLDEKTDIFDEVAGPQFGQPSSPLDPTLSDAERAAVSSPYEPGNIGAERDWNLMTPLVEIPRVDAGGDSPITRGIMQSLNPNMPPEATAAIINQLGGLASGMTSGAGQAALGLGPVVGSVGRALIGGSFAAPMMADVPEAAREAGRLSVEGTPQEAFDAAGRLGADILMPAAIGGGVAADLRSRPMIPGTSRTLPDALRREPVTAPKVESLGERINALSEATGDAFNDLVRREDGKVDITGAAQKIGREVATLSELDQLRETYTKTNAELRADTKSNNTKPQMFREAIEEATRSGSGENFGPLGKLDYKTNPEVAAWIEKHAKEIWPSHYEAIAEKAKLAREAIAAEAKPSPSLDQDIARYNAIQAEQKALRLAGRQSVNGAWSPEAVALMTESEAIKNRYGGKTPQPGMKPSDTPAWQTKNKPTPPATPVETPTSAPKANARLAADFPIQVPYSDKFSVSLQVAGTEFGNGAKESIVEGLPRDVADSLDSVKLLQGEIVPSNKGMSVPARAELIFKNKASAQRAIDYFKNKTDSEKAPVAETSAGSGGVPPPKTPPTGSAGAGGEPAPQPDLSAVYKIFEPAPKQRQSIGSALKGASESIRTGLSSKFRPLDKLTDDINSTYGSEAKHIAGTFEALKGSTGRSEAEVFRFDNDVSRGVKGNEKDFNAYLFLKRSLDRLNMDAADISKALEGGDVKKLNRRAVAGYTIPQLEANLAALETKIGPEVKATFEKSADQYQQHMDKALRWQVESGRMSPEVYDSIKAGNQFYAPFKVLKYLEESNRPAGTGKRIDTPAEYTKAMEGIEDPNFKLGDMLAAGRMGLRVSRILSDKHAAMRTMADLAPFDVEGRFIQRLKEGAEAPEGSEAVNVFENGKQVRYAVPMEVAEAVQLFDTQRTGLVETIFRGGAVPFRAGATAWNIPFQVSNLMADIPRSVLVARTGFRGNPVDIVRLPIDYAHSVIASIMGDVVSPLTGIKPPKLFLDFLDSGAAGTTMQEAFTPGLLRFHQSSRLAQGTKLGKSVLRTIPQIATAIEQSTKIFGVKRAMRMSGQESGAALYKNAKDLLTEVRQFSGSPDFGRIGKWTDAYRLNVMVPFLNARIQGTVADLGRLSGRDGAKTAAATWTKLGLAIGVPTAALYALNNSDEYADDYAKIPEKEKQNYWHFPKDTFVTLDNGERIRDYWRIPKRESGKWVANLTESSLDFARKSNPEQAGRWLRSLLEDVSPVNIQGKTAQERGESVVSGVNPLLKAPLEVVTGRDLYRHRDVVPQSMQKASPENQFTDRTPEAFKRLAEAMPDVAPEVLRSPIMLENMTRNLTAGLFTQFLPGKPVEGRTEFENNPLMKRFQAALYTDERELRQEIQSLQREAADTYLERNRAAEKILKDSKGAPLKDVLVSAARTPGADVRLLQHTVDLYVAEKAGITGPERQLIALPVQQRAQFIIRKLDGASPEMKKEIYLNFARKRILTEAVAEEMATQMTPAK